MRSFFFVILAIAVTCLFLALLPSAKACDGVQGLNAGCYSQQLQVQSYVAAPLVQQYAVAPLAVQAYAVPQFQVQQSYGYVQQFAVQPQRQFQLNIGGGRQRFVNRQRSGFSRGRNVQRVRGGHVGAVRAQAVIVNGY